MLGKEGNSVNEKRKLTLPPIKTQISERKTKQRILSSLKRKYETNTSARNILNRNCEGSSQLNESIMRFRSQEKFKQFNVKGGVDFYDECVSGSRDENLSTRRRNS